MKFACFFLLCLMWSPAIVFKPTYEAQIVASLYFCWAVLEMPIGWRFTEPGWICVDHWLMDEQIWDWTQTTDIWSPCSFSILTYHLATKGKKSSETASWTWIQQRKTWCPHHPTPNRCDVKILHFTWPFLYSFSINPKAAFTEGGFGIEHNFRFIESD